MKFCKFEVIGSHCKGAGNECGSDTKRNHPKKSSWGEIFDFRPTAG